MEIKTLLMVTNILTKRMLQIFVNMTRIPLKLYIINKNTWDFDDKLMRVTKVWDET